MRNTYTFSTRPARGTSEQRSVSETWDGAAAQGAPSGVDFRALRFPGLISAFTLPASIYPPLQFPRIVIIVDNDVVPAPQTLVSVTRPIEEAMNGVPGIQRIKSKTSRGSSERL